MAAAPLADDAFAACLARSRSSPIASGRCSTGVFSSAADSRAAASTARSSATAAPAVIASMRRTLAALELSPCSLKTPISAVLRTCVPPHSSREYAPSPICTIRTTSPYFSPKSAIAPSARASSSVVVIGRTGSLRRTHSLTRSSIARRSSGEIRSPWEKSKRSLSGPT